LAPDTANPNFFSSAHGLVQTHPLGATGFGDLLARPAKGPEALAAGIPLRPRKIDAPKKSLIELERNPTLSSPEECARACREGEPPRTCYYHFTAELYTVLGA